MAALRRDRWITIVSTPFADSGPSNPARPRWTLLAHILRPQGRKGEVLAELLTDFPERFETRKSVFLAPPDFAGWPEDARAIEVVSFWLPVGKNEGRVVLQLSDIDSISKAELLAGLDVLVPETARMPLEDDTSYISDLTGCTLFDLAGAAEPVPVGIVIDVQFATTPDGSRRLEDAAPLLSVEAPDGSEILIPFVKVFLVSLDLAARRIEMSLPSGLLDINRT